MPRGSFQFPGVGRSCGEHLGGDGEVKDAPPASAIVDDADRRTFPWSLMTRSDIDRFVLAAPGATTRDWSFLDQTPADGLVVQVGADSGDVATLTGNQASLSRSLHFEVIEGAGHVFENDLKTVRELDRNYARRAR